MRKTKVILVLSRSDSGVFRRAVRWRLLGPGCLFGAVVSRSRAPLCDRRHAPRSLQREMSFCFPGGEKTEQIARVENRGQPRQICPNGSAIRTGLRSRYSSVVSPDQKTLKVANVVPIRFRPLVEPCPSLYRSSIDAVRTPNARLILLRIEESGPPSKSTRRRAASSCRAGRERLRGGYPQ